MFRELINLLKQKDLSNQNLDKCEETLKIGSEMFTDAIKAFREGGPDSLADDVLLRDETINRSERDIRRRILTHLSVSDKIDFGANLTIVSIIIDIERIGDYTKNIADLALLHAEPLNVGKFEKDLKKLEDTVRHFFDHTLNAFHNDDRKEAKKVTSEYKKLSWKCSQIKESLIMEESGLKCGEAVSFALYLRFLKRIAAHLHNICTGVRNPFPTIGYKANVDDKKDEK